MDYVSAQPSEIFQEEESCHSVSDTEEVNSETDVLVGERDKSKGRRDLNTILQERSSLKGLNSHSYANEIDGEKQLMIHEKKKSKSSRSLVRRHEMSFQVDERASEFIDII